MSPRREPPETTAVPEGSDEGAPGVLARSLLARCTFPPPGTPLACAVSGGRDSMCLLVLAVAAGCATTAIHVDHGLRRGSATEAARVEAAARRLGAEFRATRVQVPPGTNLEARARAARFGVLPRDVATGHTMDDQAETVLVNLLRGTGPDGLAAMAPGTEHPLLGLRRSETQAVCEEAGVEWFDDPTNLDGLHLRSRVRLELMPLLRDISRRDPVPLLDRLARLAREDRALLEALAAEAVPDATSVAQLRAAPRPLAARALRGWLRGSGATGRMGGRRAPSGLPGALGDDGPGPPAGDPGADRYPPTMLEVEKVLTVVEGVARAAELSGGSSVRRSRGRLSVSAPQGGREGNGSRAPH